MKEKWEGRFLLYAPCLLFGSPRGGEGELKEETPRNEFLKTAEETQGARQEGNIGPWVA